MKRVKCDCRIQEAEILKKHNEEVLKIETQKVELLESRLDKYTEKVNQLEVQMATASEQEKGLSQNNLNLQKEVKNRMDDITHLNQLLTSQKKTIEKYETEINELKNSINELKTKYAEEFELERK